MAKPMMVFVIRNATHSLAAGMEATVLWLPTLGLVAQTLTAGVSSITASVMRPATILTVCMTTLTAKTKRKSAIQYMKPTVSTTTLMISVTRAATQRSVAGMAWTVQRRFQKTLLMGSWFL